MEKNKQSNLFQKYFILALLLGAATGCGSNPDPTTATPPNPTPTGPADLTSPAEPSSTEDKSPPSSDHGDDLFAVRLYGRDAKIAYRTMRVFNTKDERIGENITCALKGKPYCYLMMKIRTGTLNIFVDKPSTRRGFRSVYPSYSGKRLTLSENGYHASITLNEAESEIVYKGMTNVVQDGTTKFGTHALCREIPSEKESDTPKYSCEILINLSNGTSLTNPR